MKFVWLQYGIMQAALAENAYCYDTYAIYSEFNAIKMILGVKCDNIIFDTKQIMGTCRTIFNLGGLHLTSTHSMLTQN